MMKHRMRSWRPPSPRTVRHAWILVALVGAAIVIWLIVRILQLSADVGGAESLLEDQGRALDQANRNLIALGEKPVEVPPAGPQGLPGPGPTDEQVETAVTIYCATTRACEGHAPTADQVASAVTRYCNARGQCRGDVGKPGEDGTDGVNGTDGEPGPGGPPPTAEQVAVAVADYCSTRDNCQGPTGPQGPQGPAGADGQDGKDGFVVPGTYDCGEGNHVQGFTSHDDGTVTLDCQPNVPPN